MTRQGGDDNSEERDDGGNVRDGNATFGMTKAANDQRIVMKKYIDIAMPMPITT
jgi:hypothetical protein